MEPLAAEGWHVVALDLPGFGLSEKTSQSKTPPKENTIQQEFISTAKETHNINVITNISI